MMITSKHTTLIILICLLILLALGGYFLCWPKYQEFKWKKVEIETKDEEIRKKEEYILNLGILSEKLSAYEEQFSKIDSALPKDSSIADLLNFFEKTSSENGLILTDIDVSGLFSSETSVQQSSTQEDSGGKIQKMSFSISVSGSYSAFKNFLSAVYRSSRLIEVKSIGFSSSEEKKDLFDFNLNLEAQSYAP